MAKSDRSSGVQYAALPYRTREDGSVDVLLITSRTTRRWIIPKGWPIRGRDGRDVARSEALEEAGVEGRVAESPAGRYAYTKEMPDGEKRLVRVDVFPLLVTTQLDSWAEQHERSRDWFERERAAALVAEPGLSDLIMGLP